MFKIEDQSGGCCGPVSVSLESDAVVLHQSPSYDVIEMSADQAAEVAKMIFVVLGRPPVSG